MHSIRTIVFEVRLLSDTIVCCLFGGARVDNRSSDNRLYAREAGRVCGDAGEVDVDALEIRSVGQSGAN